MEGLAGDLIRFATTGTGDCPQAIAYLLDWFSALSSRRTVGMAANPISYAEIEAWSRLTDTRPTPWEVSILVRLDDAFLAKASQTTDDKEPTGAGPDAVNALMASVTGKKSRKSKRNTPDG